MLVVFASSFCAFLFIILFSSEFVLVPYICCFVEFFALREQHMPWLLYGPTKNLDWNA